MAAGSGGSWGAALAAALGLVCAATGSASAALERVVLVTVDTLRADHVGAYGGPVATPALDRLAAEGVLVEDAVTPVPSTGPAHASLFTGLHPWRHGTLRNAVRLDPRIPTLADALRGRGLATAAFVSSFILDRRFGFHQGFDRYRFEPTQGYRWRGRDHDRFWSRGAETVDAAMQWLTAHAGEPFFVWVHLFDPHTPYLPPPGFAPPPDTPVDLDGKSLPGDTDARRLRDLNLAYRGEVAYADAQIGHLIERLRLLAVLDRTAVIVTSDHGEGLGDHGVLEHGVNVHEELVRVPLLVRAPGLPAGRRLRGAVQLEDLKPTILALVGADPPAGLDGVNLLPWLRGAAERSPRAVALGRRRPHSRLLDQYFVRSWPEKWMGGLDGPGWRYDLVADPRERTPRRGEGVPAALRQALDRAPPRSEAPVDPDPEVQRALEALGYLDE